MAPQQTQRLSLTTKIVEQIADHKGIDEDDPDFCLYEDTDPEALQVLLANTNGPISTNLQIADTSVTVEKTSEGEITVEVESMAIQQRALD